MIVSHQRKPRNRVRFVCVAECDGTTPVPAGDVYLHAGNAHNTEIDILQLLLRVAALPHQHKIMQCTERDLPVYKKFAPCAGVRVVCNDTITVAGVRVSDRLQTCDVALCAPEGPLGTGTPGVREWIHATQPQLAVHGGTRGMHGAHLIGNTVCLDASIMLDARARARPFVVDVASRVRENTRSNRSQTLGVACLRCERDSN